MICNNCGNNIVEGDKFCRNCGMSLKGENNYDDELLRVYVGKNYDFNMNNVDDYFNSNKFKKDIENVNEINDYLNLATKYYDKSYKY